MKKRIISFFTALNMTLMLFGTLNISADDGSHTHKVCADSNHVNCIHSEVEYELFPTGLNIITSDANYYLTEDLTDDTLIYDIFIENATVNLCLNGHTITTEKRCFTVSQNGELNICDCKTGGCITNTLYTEGVVGAGTNGKLNIYSGKFQGQKGGGISTEENSVVNIYGGEITSAEADCIWLRTGSTISIYGGTVESTTDNKDGIYTFGNTKINLNGGTIIGKRYGIRLDKGNNTANINGGTVIGTDNAAVYAKSEDTLNINGGKVFSDKGNYSILNYGTTNISGGIIGGGNNYNYILNCGSLNLQGSPTLTNAGIYLYNDNNISISGALTNTEAYPIYVQNSSLPRTFTSGWDTYMTDKNVSKYFKSPYNTVKIAYRNNEATKVYYYKITYDANGGSCSVQSTEADASDKLTSFVVPTREGYNFDGWFTEETGGEQITTDTVFTNDTTIYAHWTCDHSWGDTYEKDENQHWQICTRCNAESEKSNHTWDEGEETTPPTEDTEGVKTFTCTVCTVTKTESVPKLTHTHTYSTEWASDSTSHWHAATCGHDVTSEAAAHTEDGGTVTVPATTENDGLKTYACSVCGYVMRTVTIPKLGEDHAHNFSPDWKHDSTSHWHECDCGEKNEITPHVEDGGVVTTEPTETSTGIMTYSCETCGYVMRTDVIPALTPEHNHTFGTDWKYDSVSHWHECECGEKSDIANHISSDWIVEIPATTDLEGVQIRKCTVCGIEIDRETIEKLPNSGSIAEYVQDTAGTNARLVQDNTLIENVLTTDDKTEVTEGHSFEIVLEVTDIRDSVPASDVAAASSALRYNEQIGIYVDLSLFKIKDNSERTPIYNTSGRIGITLTVPDSIYASDRTYSIIRVHDGIAENLGGTYDKASRELTFYTDKFSTYAIAYTASNGGTDRPSVPDTPTNPSVPTYPNTPVVPVTPTVTETTVKKEEEVISDEPYVEDVSSAAGIYESGETDNNIHYFMILIFAAAAGIAVIAAKKHFCKKNMK